MAMLRTNIHRFTPRRCVSSVLKTQGPWKHVDFLSPTQAEQLDASLQDYLPVGRHARLGGEITPPGYHLVYFNPKHREADMSADGYESFQAPDGAAFPVRMWVGGSIEFNPATNLLLGLPSRAVETVADIKQQPSSKSANGNGAERLKVTIQRELKNVEDVSPWAVREMRTLMYFADGAFMDRQALIQRTMKPLGGAEHTHVLTPSPLLLFRYSALTFNSHKVHLDREYAVEQEQLPDLLVQGPLMVSLLLRWVSTSVLGQYPGVQIESFSYKNLLPAFVNRSLTLCSQKVGAKFNVWIQDDRESMVLSGTVTTTTPNTSD